MIIKYLNKLLSPLGLSLERKAKSISIFPTDLEPEFLSIYEVCKPYTMTSIERMYALFQSVKYIVTNNIQGDFVECGTWRGGSSMMMAKTLLAFGDNQRKIFMYDTFEGMSTPSAKDLDYSSNSAEALLAANSKDKENIMWCYSPLEDVRNNMVSTLYPEQNLIFIKGKVEETIPKTVPHKVALLRLDTDWYESTKHELEQLYPLLTPQGTLIIDDYGHWQGARLATDEYLNGLASPILLHRIDNTGRIAIKTAS